MINDGRPRLAIVDPNTLATIGLKQLLQNVMPIMTVDTFGSFAELEANGPDNYYHFFVAMNLVLENRSFFLEHRRKTIVLTMSNDPSTQLKDFHSLCINVPENILVRSLLMIFSYLVQRYDLVSEKANLFAIFPNGSIFGGAKVTKKSIK